MCTGLTREVEVKLFRKLAFGDQPSYLIRTTMEALRKKEHLESK